MEVNNFLFNMKAKKSLGQNFLIDNNVITKIINSLDATKDDLIIEIGPGRGALTKLLKEKEALLLAFELDSDLMPILQNLEDSKTKIINKDILSVDLTKEIQNYSYNNLYIIGNLPYYITTPIIKHLINQNLKIKNMIFMVQDEVADRFTAMPKSRQYGSITLYLKYYFDVEKLFRVSKNSFNPVPKVESAIIKFTERAIKPAVDKEKYFKVVNDAFSQKRKTLKNNLKDYDFAKVKEILSENGFNELARAEELDEKVFIQITNSL